MSINLTDEIEVKTKKGKLGAAKQIFLEGDVQTVEKEIQDINSRHNSLNTKHESLSKTVQGIAVTGGASTANNVTYNNDSSGLNAENAQDAIDEIANKKFDKTSIVQESGEAEDKVMSQKAVSTKLSGLSYILGLQSQKQVFEPNDILRNIYTYFNIGSKALYGLKKTSFVTINFENLINKDLSLVSLSVYSFELKNLFYIDFQTFFSNGAYNLTYTLNGEYKDVLKSVKQDKAKVFIELNPCNSRLVSVDKVSVSPYIVNSDVTPVIAFTDTMPEGDYSPALRKSRNIDELLDKKIDKSSIVQKMGENQELVLSQKALNDLFLSLGVKDNMYEEPFNGENGYIKVDGTNSVEDTNWKRSDFLEIDEYSFISFRLHSHELVSSIAFYGSDKRFISSIVKQNTEDYEDTVIAPKGSKYIRWTDHKINQDHYVKIIKSTEIAELRNNKLNNTLYVNVIGQASGFGYLSSKNDSVGGQSVDKNWVHSDYIPVYSKTIIDYKLRGHNNVGSILFFDNEYRLLDDKVILTSSDSVVGKVEVPTNAAYMRFCDSSLSLDSDYIYLFIDVEKFIKEIHFKNNEKLELEVCFPYAIYDVCNDVPNSTYNGGRNRNLSTALYLDHFLSGLMSEKNIRFNNGSDRLIFQADIKLNSSDESNPTSVFNYGKNISEEWIKESIGGNDAKTIMFNIVHRSTLNSVTANSHPKVLCIGDSITYGEQATMPNDDYASNNAYHLICKQLFMKDSIDNGNSGYDITFLGHYFKENTFTYKGKDYKCKTHHEGIRGISMTSHLSGNVTEFEDNGNWSLNSWIGRYRTLDDDGNRLPWSNAGGTVEGKDGKKYKIGSEINSEELLNSIDVCLPTHVIIALSMNGGCTLEQYQTMIASIREAAPNSIIGICIPDCEGTYFPSLHENCGYNCSYWSNSQNESYHIQQQNVQRIITKAYANTESENNNIYVLPFLFVTPPAESVSNREINLPDGEYNILKSNKFVDAYGWMPNVHTNAYGHMNWGYCLYSWIKYTIAKSLAYEVKREVHE